MMIGITGVISSGKTLVSKYLEKKGYDVFYADAFAQEGLRNDFVIQKLIERFGSDIIEGGAVNRKKLGEIIYYNKQDRAYLNALIHPLVIESIRKIDSKGKLVFVEVPLLYEANLVGLFQKVIVVYAEKRIMLSRLMERDNITLDYARKKIASQMDIKEKCEQADFVIDNSKDINYTYEQIETILRRLR